MMRLILQYVKVDVQANVMLTTHMSRRTTCDTMQTGHEESEEVDIEHNPVAMVAAKIHMYFSIASEKIPEIGNLVSWWWNERYRMPSLAEVAAALLVSKHVSGGLECDFGSLNDIITPKISSLGGGVADSSINDVEVEQTSNVIRSQKVDLVG